MRAAFAHAAALVLAPGGDLRAPGGAITVALCGACDHQPPCPRAPHHTAVTQDDRAVHLRILFATEPDREALVRACIDRALTAQQFHGPDGRLSQWQLRSSQRSAVRRAEADHAQRLLVQ